VLRCQHGDNRRPAPGLEILAGSPNGVTEPVMRAHGFTVELLAGLVRAGRQPIEVTWLTITDSGRRCGAVPSGRVIIP
jgi:hypothetical protein